ncbi:unnamed protein product [Ranitomeya imitator]|uniref:Uncharacterized protein n=1 Tax=Ranitomeya imitator TaxID=111125 RepID=A0ABN9MEA5_9NEOB|nr:unnamed protein product [Ranitomeya imitator]
MTAATAGNRAAHAAVTAADGRSRMESDTWLMVSKKKAMKKSSRLQGSPACHSAGCERPDGLYSAQDCTDGMKRIDETM